MRIVFLFQTFYLNFGILISDLSNLVSDLGLDGADNKVLTRLEKKKKSQQLITLKQKPGAR